VTPLQGCAEQAGLGGALRAGSLITHGHWARALGTGTADQCCCFTPDCHQHIRQDQAESRRPQGPDCDVQQFIPAIYSGNLFRQFIPAVCL